jgi:hypothetical protein
MCFFIVSDSLCHDETSLKYEVVDGSRNVDSAKETVCKPKENGHKSTVHKGFWPSSG